MGGSQVPVFSEGDPRPRSTLLPEEMRALHLAQQCRPEDLEAARDALEPLGLAGWSCRPSSATCRSDSTCHLAVTRAGASTIAELTCVGRPAILVPARHRRPSDRQRPPSGRGRRLAGAAALLHRPGPGRAAVLLADPQALAASARAAHDWGTADAATALADAVLAMLDEARPAAPIPSTPIKPDLDHDQSHNARRSAAGASTKGAAE